MSLLCVVAVRRCPSVWLRGLEWSGVAWRGVQYPQSAVRVLKSN